MMVWPQMGHWQEEGKFCILLGCIELAELAYDCGGTDGQGKVDQGAS